MHNSPVTNLALQEMMDSPVKERSDSSDPDEYPHRASAAHGNEHSISS